LNFLGNTQVFKANKIVTSVFNHVLESENQKIDLKVMPFVEKIEVSS